MRGITSLSLLRGHLLYLVKCRILETVKPNHLAVSARTGQRHILQKMSTFPHFATEAIHVGQEPEQWNSMAVVPPISMASTFKQRGPAEHAIFTLAESLGGYESLVELPSLMTHASVPPNEREQLKISDSLIRLSVGLEDEEDLIEELDQALKAAVQL